MVTSFTTYMYVIPRLHCISYRRSIISCYTQVSSATRLAVTLAETELPGSVLLDVPVRMADATCMHIYKYITRPQHPPPPPLPQCDVIFHSPSLMTIYPLSSFLTINLVISPLPPLLMVLLHYGALCLRRHRDLRGRQNSLAQPPLLAPIREYSGLSYKIK